MKFCYNRLSSFREEVVLNCGRTDDGRTTEPAYTISSPGSFGSGELKSSYPLIRFICNSCSVINFCLQLTLDSSKSKLIPKGLRALRPFLAPHLRSKYKSGNKSISLHDFIRPIFLVFHFGFSLDLAVH